MTSKISALNKALMPASEDSSICNEGEILNKNSDNIKEKKYRTNNATHTHTQGKNITREAPTRWPVVRSIAGNAQELGNQVMHFSASDVVKYPQ